MICKSLIPRNDSAGLSRKRAPAGSAGRFPSQPSPLRVLIDRYISARWTPAMYISTPLAGFPCCEQNQWRAVRALAASVALHVALLLYLHQHILAVEFPASPLAPPALTATIAPPSSKDGANESKLPPGTVFRSSSTASAQRLTRIPEQSTAQRSQAIDPGASDAEPPGRSIDIPAAIGTAREYAKLHDSFSGQPNAPAAKGEGREAAVASAISRSARADCRTSYSGMGLLALPFILTDTVADRGCKW